MSFARRIPIALALACALGSACPAFAQDGDRAAIREKLLAAFDRPEARLGLDAIVVADDAAIADWAQGEAGGRALLRLRNGVWAIMLCSGDALKSAAALERAGLPPQRAAALAAALAEAEARLAPERLALFSRFEGEVVMDGSGAPPPGHAR